MDFDPHMITFLRPLALVAGISLMATSCATFPNNQLPKVAASAPSQAAKVPVTYTMKAGHNLTGSRSEFGDPQVQQLQKPLVSTLEQSGRFSSVRQGKGGAVQVDVDLLNHGNAAGAAISGFITGFSLFTIPGFAVDNYKLTATVRGKSGKSRQYVLEDGVTTVFWLPLIVATPFSFPNQVIPKVHENMYRNLLQNMENDGLLPKAAN